MQWNDLSSVAALDSIKEVSFQQPVVIFKHSTRCPISSGALRDFEGSWNDEDMEGVKPYYLDLISHRDVSNKVASTFGVTHQSPQVLLIDKGECVYDESHWGIKYDDLKGHVEGLPQ